jgi:hypothetical protein
MESMEVSFMGRRVRKAEHNQELVVEVVKWVPGVQGSRGESRGESRSFRGP